MTQQATRKSPVNRAPSAFWTVLNLRFVSIQQTIWYYSNGEGFEGNPIGKLTNIELQLKEFEGKTEPKLLVCLQNQQANYLLVMGLRTISALSLVENLLVMPRTFFSKDMTISHEFLGNGNNTTVKLTPVVGDYVFDTPNSSARLWRLHCFYRVNQLKARLEEPTIPEAFRLEFASDLTF